LYEQHGTRGLTISVSLTVQLGAASGYKTAHPTSDATTAAGSVPVLGPYSRTVPSAPVEASQVPLGLV